MSRMGSSAASAPFGLSAGLELGQAPSFSFICVVIALYLVRKSSELARLHIRIELDVDGALPFSITPGFSWCAILHGCWWAEQGTKVALALADEIHWRGRGGRACCRGRRGHRAYGIARFDGRRCRARRRVFLLFDGPGMYQP